MAIQTDNIVIAFTADTDGLKPGIDALQKLGAISKEELEDFKKANEELKKRSPAIAANKSEMDKLATAAQNVQKNIVNGATNEAMAKTQEVIKKTTAEVKKYEDSLTGLKQQYKDLVAQAIKAGESSPFGKKLLKEAGEVKDRIGDIQAATKAFASDTGTFDAIGQGINTIGAGFQAAASAEALFGDGNEEVQKTLTRLTAIMGLVNGLQTIQNNLQAESALRLKLATVQQVVYNTVVGTSTGVMKGFKIALASTGIGLIVLAIAALIGNFDSIKKAVTGFIDKFYPLKVIVGAVADAFTYLYDKVHEFFEFIGVADSKAMNKLQDTLEGLNGKLDESIKKNEQYAKIRKAVGEDTRKFEEDYNKKVFDITKQGLAGLDLLKKKGVLTEKEYNEQYAELRDKNVASFVTFHQLQDEISQRALASQKAVIDSQLLFVKKGSDQEYALRLAAIEKNRQLALSAKDLTSGAEAEINAKARKDRQQLEQEFYQIRIKGQKATLEAQLALVVKGSEDELALKKQILEKQLMLEVNGTEISQQEKVKLNNEYYGKLQDLNDAYYKAQDERRKLDMEKERANIERLMEDRQAYYNNLQALADIELNNVYTTEGRKQELRLKAFDTQLRALLDEEQSIEDLHDKGLLTEEEYQRKITEIRDKENLNRQAQQNEADAIELENRKRLLDQVGQISQQSLDYIRQGEQIFFDRRIQDLDMDAKHVEDSYKQKKISDKEYAAEKKKVEDAIRAEKQKQARVDKVLALFDVGINTAIAVSKSIAASPTTFGLPFSAFALAQGAIQAALIAAKPIPAFAKGTKNAPRGWAWVGEEGAELVNFKGGEVVKTHQESLRMSGPTLFDSLMNVSSPVFTADQSGREMIDMKELSKLVGAEVGRHIEKLPLTMFSFDRHGFQASLIAGHETERYLNSRYSSK